MNQSETNNVSFFDTLPPDTSSEQFKEAVSQVIGEEEYKALGEDAPELITDSLAFLGAFAPAPATFYLDAFQAVTLLEEEKAEQIVNFGIKMGLIERREDLLSVKPKIIELFRSFLT